MLLHTKCPDTRAVIVVVDASSSISEHADRFACNWGAFRIPITSIGRPSGHKLNHASNFFWIVRKKTRQDYNEHR